MKALKTILAVLLFASTKMAIAQNGEIVYVGQPEKNTMVYCNSCPSDSSYIHIWFDDIGATVSDAMLCWAYYKCAHNIFYASNGWNIHKGECAEGDTIANISTNWFEAWSVGYGEGYYGDSLIMVFRKLINENDSSYIYAWLRFSIEEYHGCVISNEKIRFYLHDYAYCTIPNYPLRVGQTSLDWGMEENKNTFTIYPNPTTGKACIALPENNNAINKIEVCNTLGAIVLETANMQGNTLDVSSLPAGVYIVRIVTDDGKQRFGKLVKK